MYLVRFVTLTAVILTATAPLVAQGIPRNARARQSQTVANSPRFMVANPFAFASADSAPAVAIGSSMREEMKDVVGRDYTVVERTQMNEALTQYGYPADAILSPALATTLAKNIQGRFLVSSTMAKSEGNRYAVTARLTGVNDDAGNVVALTQNAGESPDAFGKRLAKALEPAVESLEDAKACIDQRTSKTDKATEAAQKAIKVVPNHGLAHYCLAQIAQAQKSPRPEIVQHLQAASKGDALSLPVWTALATQYQQANDTANTLVAFKQMLRVAPTNQKLREELFKYFLQSGHPETALEVADEGLKIDPYNADLYDLKSNACLFLSNFKCAVDALETMYATDSTKADTLFFTKISAAAAEGEKPDTVRLLKWASAGVRKYPDNPTLLSYLNRAYGMTGQVDSVVAVTNRIITKDTTQVDAALAAAQVLITPPANAVMSTPPPAATTDTMNRGAAPADTGAAAAAANPRRGRPKEALPFLEYAIRYGDAQAKENASALLYTGAAPLLQQPQDLAGAAELLRVAVQNSNKTGKVYPASNYLLGLATLFQVPQLDPQAEKQKSCDISKQMEGLLFSADTALTAGRAVNPEAADKNLGIIKQYKPRVASMLKAYCK
jgi:tetratricopeptide (TPR) repeat protein